MSRWRAPVRRGFWWSHVGWILSDQYNETDFDFVCRLMEEEGIYYFFKHSLQCRSDAAGKDG